MRIYTVRVKDVAWFMERVEKREDGCWAWLQAHTSTGYARFVDNDNKSHNGHKWLYEKVIGPVPKGFDLDHLCRNRWCVNYNHLESVTHKENVHRGNHPSMIAFRTNTCKRGHDLTLNSVVRENGSRICVPCRNMRNAFHRAKKKEDKLYGTLW